MMLTRAHLASFVALGLLVACAGVGTATISQSRIDAAISAPIRTDKDRADDVSRRPKELLRFLALRDGDKVAEINAGPGYNARLLATAVGSDGVVYATNAEFVLQMFVGLNDRLSDSLVDAANVQVSAQGNDRLDLPEAVDLAILNNNYHDLHWQKIDTAAFNQAVFDSLRPGGYFVVGDHQAQEGSGIEHVSTLHRIDREVVVSELEAAGFVLVSTANILANSDDDRSKAIFDPAIRGKTDRFLLKFRRPE